jgi:hypothetical protein
MPLRLKIGLVIGAVMAALGTYIALHPLWSRDPVSSSRFLDLAFATFFLVKGYLYLRPAWRRPREPDAGTRASSTDRAPLE